MTRVLFPNYLFRLRRNRQLSQKRLAALVGVSVDAVSKYERGVCLPSTLKAMRLEIVLSAKLSEMYVDVYQQQVQHVIGRESRLPSTDHAVRNRWCRKESA